MLKYLQALARWIGPYLRWCVTLVRRLAQRCAAFTSRLAHLFWRFIPSYLAFYLLIIVVGYALYLGRQQAIVISAFQIPSKSETQGFPFSSETVANVLRDAIYSIRQEAEGRSLSSPCHADTDGDALTFGAMSPVLMTNLYERPSSIIVEVKGLSVAGLVSVAREALGREKLISGDVVLDSGGTFQLIARSNDAGPWVVESQEISLSGLRRATCALAEDVMKISDRNVLASAWLRRGKYEDVIALYGSKGFEDDPFALNNLGMALGLLGHHDDSVVRFRQAVARDQSSPDSHANLSAALSYKWCFDNAVVEAEKALALKGDSSTAEGNLAYALSKEGRWNEGIAHYKKAVVLEPSAAIWHVNLGTALELTGRHDEADAELKKGLNLRPDSPHVHRAVGTAYSLGGRIEKAIAEYLKAIELKPDYPEAHMELAQAYLVAKRVDEANSECRQLLARNSDSAEGHECLGIALELKKPYDPFFALDHNDEIVAELRKAVDLKPDSADYHYILGNALASYFLPSSTPDPSRLDESISELRGALALRCSFPAASENLKKAETLKARQTTAGH